jgi:hypothetical protein
MKSIAATAWIGALGLLMALLGASCHDPPNDCTALREQYEGAIAGICATDALAPSRYCTTCVQAGFYSYVVDRPGVCRCAPLIFTGGKCAGNADEEALLGAVTAADTECATFESDGGVAGADAGSEGPDGDDGGPVGGE